MTNSKLRNSMLMAALALSMFATPATQAQSRDTGVSALIAAQGNQALQAIKAELKLAIQSLKPVKSQLKAPRPVAIKAKLAAVKGSGAGLAATARCAP